MALAHSYSSVKDFEGCPRRYHEVRILKKFKSQDTAATMYGTAVHKAFEDYIRDGTPLPEQFKMFELFGFTPDSRKPLPVRRKTCAWRKRQFR